MKNCFKALELTHHHARWMSRSPAWITLTWPPNYANTWRASRSSCVCCGCTIDCRACCCIWVCSCSYISRRWWCISDSTFNQKSIIKTTSNCFVLLTIDNRSISKSEITGWHESEGICALLCSRIEQKIAWAFHFNGYPISIAIRHTLVIESQSERRWESSTGSGISTIRWRALWISCVSIVAASYTRYAWGTTREFLKVKIWTKFEEKSHLQQFPWS